MSKSCVNNYNVHDVEATENGGGDLDDNRLEKLSVDIDHGREEKWGGGGDLNGSEACELDGDLDQEMDDPDDESGSFGVKWIREEGNHLFQKKDFVCHGLKDGEMNDWAGHHPSREDVENGDGPCDQSDVCRVCVHHHQPCGPGGYSSTSLVEDIWMTWRSSWRSSPFFFRAWRPARLSAPPFPLSVSVFLLLQRSLSPLPTPLELGPVGWRSRTFLGHE